MLKSKKGAQIAVEHAKKVTDDAKHAVSKDKKDKDNIEMTKIAVIIANHAIQDSHKATEHVNKIKKDLIKAQAHH